MKRLLQTQLAVLAGLILLLGSQSTSVAVEICHLNQTISVSNKGARKHIKKHGDTLGACAVLPTAVLPTQTSRADTVATATGPCVIKVSVGSDGCVTDIDPEDSCPTSVVEEFTVVIGGNANSTAAGCGGNAKVPGSFRYCYPNAAGSMTCITF